MVMTLENIDKFYKFLGTLLIVACLYVPYTVIQCNARGACMVTDTGYRFVGDLPMFAEINTTMLVIEIIVILAIGLGYRFLANK